MCIRDSRHGLAPIGRAVTGGAVVNALANERFLAGNAQGTGRRAGGDDHRAALKDALAGVQRLDSPGKANLVPVSYTHLDVYKRQAHEGSIGSLHDIQMINAEEYR